MQNSDVIQNFRFKDFSVPIKCFYFQISNNAARFTALALQDLADGRPERLPDGAVHDEVDRGVEHQEEVVEAEYQKNQGCHFLSKKTGLIVVT